MNSEVLDMLKKKHGRFPVLIICHIDMNLKKYFCFVSGYA